MEMQSYEISVDRQLEILKSVHEMYKGIV